MSAAMKDRYGRKIDYLRISVTDRCNLRCRYCMPQEGVSAWKPGQILSFEEIEEITRAAVRLGVRKVRLTGGEPLVRRGILELCRRLAAVPGIQDLSMTTNGTLLSGMADQLYQSGIRRINISLDTMNREKYQEMTRGGNLDDAVMGIFAAARAGMNPVKINTVLIRGFNDDEIRTMAELTRRAPVQLRFIELMPIGHDQELGKRGWMPCRTVLEQLPGLTPVPSGGGVAEMYRLPGCRGLIGLIRPVSCHFCGSCSRLRLTSDGYLKPCLHGDDEISVRGFHGQELEEKILEAAARKPARHGDLTERAVQLRRDMNQIGG